MNDVGFRGFGNCEKKELLNDVIIIKKVLK